MTLPLLLGALAIGVLASACRSEEEPPSRAPAEPSSGPPTPSCHGARHPLHFGSETVELCHDDVSRDGHFQPNEKLEILQGTARSSYTDVSNWKRLEEKWTFPQLKGLSLGLWVQNRDWIFSSKAAWDRESEKRLSQAMDFCRERGLDLKQVQELALRIQPPPGRTELKPKEKIYALMIAAILLDLKRPENPFAREHPEFLETVVKKIQAGRLNILDDGRDGQDDELFRQAGYQLAENTLKIFRPSLNLHDTADRASLVHELFHFYQDAQRMALTGVEVEVQAHLAEARYILGEENLLDPQVGLQDLETYLEKHLNVPGSDYSSPVLAAMRSLFHKDRGAATKAEEWLKACRQDAELIRTWDALVQVMRGPSGPGQPGSFLTVFLRAHGPTLEQNPAPLNREIARLKTEKAAQIALMRTLLKKREDPQALMLPYFRLLQKTLDLYLLESFQRKHLKPGSPTLNPMDAARGLVPLKINQALITSTDGVDP